MKLAVAVSLLLSGCGVLLGDSSISGSSARGRGTLLDDLVRLTQAGSSEATVLVYAKAHRLELPPEVSDRDLRRLRDAGVSERVVRYMAAIDVRAPEESATPEGVTYGSSEEHARPRTADSYSYPESDSDDSYDNSADAYAGNSADAYYDAYPGYDSGCCYPSYDSGYYNYGYYPYSSYFFVDRGRFFRRFNDRDRRFRRPRRFDGDRGRGFGRRGGVVGPRGSSEAWRERGFSPRRGSATVFAGPRGSGRPAFARRDSGPGFRGRIVAPRGFGPPRSARGSFPRDVGGPRSGFGGHSGFGRPAFSGGARAGGGFGHGSRGGSGPRRGR